MSDIQIYHQTIYNNSNNSNNSCCDNLEPCSCTITSTKIGCEGCQKWNKHSGSDCEELIFCCIPFTIVIDTIILPYTISKCIYNKCKKEKS
jgi:uncharacterized protein YceK